jgi:hypothetical protein
MFDLIDYRGEFSPVAFVQPDAKGLADAVGRQSPQPIPQVHSKVLWIGLEPSAMASGRNSSKR